MKHILISLFVMLAVGVNAQKVFYSGSATDTISASDTIDLWLGGTTFGTAQGFTGDGLLTVHMVTDSISGATGATAYLEYFYGRAEQDVPYRAETFTAINGAAQQSQIKEESQMPAYKARVRIISPSGAQATRVRMNWNYKEDR